MNIKDYPMMYKKCPICQEVKFFSEYYYNNEKLGSKCKICLKNYNKSRYPEYYKNNKEKYKYNSEYIKEWRDNNSNKVKKWNKDYYYDNLERHKKYYLDNKEKIQKNYKKYRKERYNSDIMFKLCSVCRCRIIGYLTKNNFKKSSKTFEMIGCTPEHLKSYLEKKFTKGMTWLNQGQWHIDHIIPLSSANTKDEVIKLCHYTNLQPLWAEDNLKKGGKF